MKDCSVPLIYVGNIHLFNKSYKQMKMCLKDICYEYYNSKKEFMFKIDYCDWCALK